MYIHGTDSGIWSGVQDVPGGVKMARCTFASQSGLVWCVVFSCVRVLLQARRSILLADCGSMIGRSAPDG